MTNNVKAKDVCQICKKQKSLSELVPSSLVTDPISSVIKEDNPNWSSDGFICSDDLNNYRSKYMHEMLKKEKGDLNELEQKVKESISDEELLSKSSEDKYDTKVTFGENLADKVADFGGSWKFISIFGVLIIGWIIFNSLTLLSSKPFDPYPYILLNLMLSCLAALQAPIIMMSQNRQETKDRLRSEYDYKVNLKAELEVQNLNEKLDFLINIQWRNLLDVQQMQIDMLDEIKKDIDKEDD